MNWFLILLCVIFLVALGNDGAEAAEAVANTVTAAPVTLQDSLVSIITSVQSGVQAGVNFLSAEIPDVIRQLLVWKAVEAGIWAGIHTLLFITGICAFRFGINSINEQSRLEAEVAAARGAWERASGTEDNRTARSQLKEAEANSSANITKTKIGCIVGAIWTIVGIIGLCNIWGHIMTVAQIYLAPKVWLIEYAASLVK